MAIDKAEKRKHDLAVKRQYEERERRQTQFLWGAFIAVMLALLGLLAYELIKPGPSSKSLKMPFIEQRLEKLKENSTAN